MTSSHLYAPSPIPLRTRIRLTYYGFINRHTELPGPDGPDEDSLRGQVQNEMEIYESGAGRLVYELPSDWVLGKGRYVVKLVRSKKKEGFDDPGLLQNWREILLSRYPPMQGHVVPVVDSGENGFWLVMPYAEQYGLDWDHDVIDEKVGEIKAMDGVTPVARGAFTGSFDVNWTENWGAYNGGYRLLDYGGIAITTSIPQYDNELEFFDPSDRP